jgi:hypothetical protein
MNHFVRRARHHVFFDQRLDPIGRRLQEAARADAIRTVTILNSAQSFAFKNRCHGEERREHSDDSRDGNHRRHHRLPGCGRQPAQPVIQRYKNLIQGIGHLKSVRFQSDSDNAIHFIGAVGDAGWAAAFALASAAALTLASASALALASAFAFSAASRPSTSAASVGWIL